MKISPVSNIKYNFPKQNAVLLNQYSLSFQSKNKPKQIEDNGLNSCKTPMDELREKIKEAETLFNQNEIEKAAGKIVEFYNANNRYEGISSLFEKEIRKKEQAEGKKPVLYIDIGKNKISFSPNKIKVAFYQKNLPTKELVISLRKFGDIKSIEAYNHKIDNHLYGNSIIYNY